MFNPRGTLPPRPRGPNPSGAKPPGAFGARGAPGPPRKAAAAPAAPHGAPPRFSGQDAPWTGGSQRINVRVTLHRADPRKVKEKSGLHQEQKGDPRVTRWDGGPCPAAGGAAPKAPGPAPALEQSRGARSRYTPESASSILASFGLSNEDLEELSRYPDDQLTPENMPRILREIRLRKLGHAAPVPRAPGRGEEAAGEGGGVVKGKVIDYGHASKYGYTEDPLEIRAYDAEAPPEEPPEARVYAAEAPGVEGREEFRRELGAPAAVPPLNPVPCAAAAFPAEDLLKLPAFPGEPSPAPTFFPAEPPAKAPVPCGAAPAKPASRQPPAPPALPPMLPALLPAPLPQPLLPPVMPPPAQPPAGQHALPPLTPPPFSAGLLAAISHHEQKQRDAGAGHKPFHKAFRSLAEEPIKSPFGVVKASWLPVFSDPQKCKRLPTPSMMNDYYATSPRIFPHLCSLCNLECALMKDWIEHQNNPEHLESCRRLRLQFPDWNPEAHSSDRNAERKENRTPRRRSASSSPGRRRSGSCRDSASSPRRRRSRSRSPGRFRRPRGRSPRRVRSRSPRRRSPSPRRCRRPPRPGAARPRRSCSAERPCRGAGRCQGPAPERPRREEQSEEAAARSPAGVNRLLREDVLSCGTVLHLSELPDAGFSDHDIKRLVQPFGKVSDLIVLRSRNEAYLEMNYKEAVMAAVKFGETEPVLLNGKRIRISVAEGAQAKKPAKKRLVSAKKAPSGTKKAASAGAKSSKAPGKKEKAKKIPGEKKAKKTSSADGKTSAEDSQVPPEAGTEIPESEAPEAKNGQNSPNSPNSEPQNPEIPENSANFEAENAQNLRNSPNPGRAAEGSEEKPETSGAGEAPGKRDADDDAEESRVLLVSNLPSGGVSPEEIRGLAEAFGGARDVLVISSHRRAFLELGGRAAASLARSCAAAPAALRGNRLRIRPQPRLRSLRDLEAIFAALIEESDPKAAPCRRSQLVHLGNLPAEGFRELEVVCAGLRFGKVEHYAVLRDRHAAILQLDSAQAARSMHSFLQQYPYSMGEHTLTCSLSAHGDAPEAEGGTKDARSEDGSRGSSASNKTPSPSPKPAAVPSGDAGKSQTPAPIAAATLPEPRPPAAEPAAGIPAGSPAARPPSEEARDEAGIPEERPELSAAPSARGETPGAVPAAPPSSAGAPGADKNPPAEVGRSGVPKNGDAPGKKRAAGGEGTAEETAPKTGEKPAEVPGDAEKTPGKASPEDETRAGNPLETVPSKGPGASEPRLGRTFLKAVVSVPDILKRRIPPEAAAARSGERKAAPKSAARPGGGGCQRRGAGGKGAAPQEKDSREESRPGSEPRRPGGSGNADAGREPGGGQAPGGGGAAAGKSGAGKQKEEDELFPFNLDEFVTVDEVLEDAEAPATPRRNPPRGKRKEAPRAEPPEPASKRRKGKSCGAGGELSFVTLDEIGEEEEEEEDPRGLVVVDEVAEEEEPSEAAKDPRALPTLDELSEQEEPGSRGRGPRADLEERDLKAEPLVTVDEIGEVEELPLDEPAELSAAAAAAAEGKSERGERAASRVPDDPNALVTVDEIQEDNEDNPLVTLDEVNEDEDDFLADFNHLKEELNFVTVDEVGDEEEESALPGKNPPEDEDDEDIVAVAGPEELGILGDAPAHKEPAEIPEPKARPGAEAAEAKAQQKKTAFPGVPKTQSAPKALDILVPKAGFFCQICSLFYADEPSMIDHCRTPLHRQNMEKFMAKQQDDDGEEPSSR